MDRKLFARAIIRFLAGLLAVGALLFVPAGTLAYREAWLLIGILFVPMFAAGLVMMKKNPDLLRKRLQVREEEAAQKTVILLSGLMFIFAFVIAGLDHRFGWSTFPAWVSPAAAILFLLQEPGDVPHRIRAAGPVPADRHGRMRAAGLHTQPV